MAFEDPYEEWKANGRKGPMPGAAIPPPPPNAQPARPPQGATTPPAPAPPAPKPDMSGFSGAGGAQRWMQASGGTQAQYDAEMARWGGGRQPAAPAPAAPAGPRAPGQALTSVTFGNGNNIEQQFAAFKAGDATGTDAYKDPNRASEAQWGAWEEEERQRVESGGSANQIVNKYNPDGKGCPPDKPFTSRPTTDGYVECAAKPDDCPDGSGFEGSDQPGNPKKCIKGFSPGGGGGGQGGPGGGGVGGGAGAGAGGGAFDDMNQWWMNQIKSGTSRYSPEAMAALEADSFARARRQEKLQLDAANRDMAERGVRGSAVMNPVKRDIAAKTSGQIMSDRANLMRAKIDADYQDKQAAIKNAESWVNSMRDFLLRSDANAIQREQIAAQIRLAQQNIAAQKDMLEQNYQNNLSMAYMTGGIG